MSERARFAVGVAAIAIAGLVVRVVYVVAFRTQQLPLPFYDSAFYTAAANNLANGRGFVQLQSFRLVESATHPPLYTIYLAAASYVWPGHVATPTVHMLWSTLLGVGTIVLCGCCAREIAGLRAGLLAAALAAIYPSMWVQDGLLLSESLVMCLTAALLFCAYRFLHAPSGWRSAWLGLLCGLTALTRPEMLLAVPLILVPLVVRARDVDWSRRLRWLAVGGIAVVVTVGPWVAYNRSRFDRPVYISANFGGTLAAANCDSTYHGSKLGFKDYDCWGPAAAEAARLEPGYDRLSLTERDRALTRVALRYVRSHLTRVPIVVGARWARIADVFHPSQEIESAHVVLEQERWAGVATVLSFYVVAVLAVMGAIVLRRRHVPIWPLLAVCGLVLITVAMTFAQLRYRAPAEVVLVVLAGIAVDASITRYRARQRARVGAPG